MTKVRRRRLSEAGYSMMELLFTVGILSVVSLTAVLQTESSRQAAKGDAAMRVVLAQLNTAQQLAITQRRNMRVTFLNNNQIQIIREEVPGPTLTTLTTVYLEGSLQFATVANLPDTPDAFCNSSIVPVSFPTATGAPPEVKFQPDGTFVNQDGIPLNGTIFLSLPGQTFTRVSNNGDGILRSSGVLSSRAATIMGSTGRVHGYRFDGNMWQPVS
jgi:type II secretory pathway pseudopilin PulG